MPSKLIRRKRHNIWLCCLVASLLGAGSANSIDLLGVYDLATQDDPELKRAQQEHQASAEILKQARAGFLPTLAFEAESGKTRQNIRNSDNPIYSEGASTFSANRLTLTLNMPLYRHTAVVNLRQANTATKQADLAFENAKRCDKKNSVFR